MNRKSFTGIVDLGFFREGRVGSGENASGVGLLYLLSCKFWWIRSKLDKLDLCGIHIGRVS